jgi:hypothetical protein
MPIVRMAATVAPSKSAGVGDCRLHTQAPRTTRPLRPPVTRETRLLPLVYPIIPPRIRTTPYASKVYLAKVTTCMPLRPHLPPWLLPYFGTKFLKYFLDNAIYLSAKYVFYYYQIGISETELSPSRWEIGGERFS